MVFVISRIVFSLCLGGVVVVVQYRAGDFSASRGTRTNPDGCDGQDTDDDCGDHDCVPLVVSNR